MKKILSVSIDTITLNIISSLLSEHTGDFEILTAETIQESDRILKKIKINIVVIDLTSPTPKDLEVLGYLAKNNPKVPFIVMTAFETGEIESTIKSIGSMRYFEKPVDFKELADRLFEEMEGGVGGEIHGISLASFLQMSEMEKTSCTLKIKTGESTQGHLYLLKGALVSAETGDHKGEEAVFEILSWDSPVIEIEDAQPGIEKNVRAPLMTLLMEGLKRKDEKTGGKKADKSKLTAKKAQKIAISSGAERLKGFTDPEGEDASAPEIPEELAEKAQKRSEKITDASEILKRQRLVANAIKAGAAVVLLIILVCLWQFAAKPWLAERKYNRVIEDVNSAQELSAKLKILDDYISQANKTYAPKAKQMKLKVAEDMKNQDFDETIQAVSQLPIDESYQEKAEKIYNAYLQKYPDNEYTNQIKKMIAQIPATVQDAAFRQLTQIPSKKLSERLEAYNHYLATNADNPNAPKVKQMIVDLGEQFYRHITTSREECDKQKNWDACLKQCDYFIANFPQHNRVTAVRQIKAEMSDTRDWLAIVSSIDKNNRYTDNTLKKYKNFLKKHPNASLKPTVEQKITQIETIRHNSKIWEDMLRYVKNENTDIFTRFQKMSDYLDSNPPQSYRKKALPILAWLEKEKQNETERRRKQKEAEQQRQQWRQNIQQKKNEVRAALANLSGRYVENKEATLTDVKTGLTWCMLDSSVMTQDCLDYAAAKKYVNALQTGGYDDWRLPTPNELIIIFNNAPAFPIVEGTRWYWTSEIFSAAWQKRVNTVKHTAHGSWEKGETNLDKCGAVRAVRP